MTARTYEYDDFGLNSLVVQHTCSDGLTMPLRHLHSQYEFLFVKSGKAVVESNATIIKIDSPTLIVHHPFSLYRANAESSPLYERYTINISNELLGRIRDLIPFFYLICSSGTTIIPFDEKTASAVFEQLEQIFNDCKSKKKQRALLEIAILLLTVTEYAAETKIPVPHSAGYIGDVIKYISSHYADDIKIAGLADYFFVSRSKLISDFKKSIGVSIKKYTMFVRISNAQHFLNTGKSITETATLCGFYDNSHFISTFRLLTGKTPKEYCKIRSR